MELNVDPTVKTGSTLTTNLILEGHTDVNEQRGHRIGQVEGKAQIALALNQTTNRLYTCSNSEIMEWNIYPDLNTGVTLSPTRVFEGHDGAISDIALDLITNRLFAASRDKILE